MIKRPVSLRIIAAVYGNVMKAQTIKHTGHNVVSINSYILNDRHTDWLTKTCHLHYNSEPTVPIHY